VAKLYSHQPRELSLQDVMPFGQYKGQTIEDVINDDYQYVDWCLKNIKEFALDIDAQDALELMVQTGGTGDYYHSLNPLDDHDYW